MSKEKSVNKNNITKQHLTKEEIAQLMGLSVPTKATSSTQEIPLHKEI